LQAATTAAIIMATTKMKVVLLPIAFAALSGTALAQPACSCSPQELTFQVNLSGGCPVSITNVDPINNICYSSKDTGTNPGATPDLMPGNQNLDLIPTQIDSISYYELNDSLQVINQETVEVDGSVDEVTFTSITSNLNPEEFLSEQAEYVVSAAVLVVTGKNAEDVSIKNTVSWKYDLQMCSAVPMAIGDTLGWVDMVGLKYAKPAFCPLVPATLEPTASPTITSTFQKQETTTEATTTTTSATVQTKSAKAAKSDTKSAKHAKANASESLGSLGSYGETHSSSKQTKAGNSKQSTKSSKGTKSSKTSTVVVNSKQSTKSSKTKSAKAVVSTADTTGKKPYEGSMTNGWSGGN
jgi:hypothetical protein